jgi:predicted translin family RNA/ssDNA-binding protein
VQFIKKKRKVASTAQTSHTKWYADDVIAVLLASLDTVRITTNVSKIHKAVFELKRKYPEFFEDLIFSGNETHPFSKELETILFRFYQTNVL